MGCDADVPLQDPELPISPGDGIHGAPRAKGPHFGGGIASALSHFISKGPSYNLTDPLES